MHQNSRDSLEIIIAHEKIQNPSKKCVFHRCSLKINGEFYVIWRLFKNARINTRTYVWGNSICGIELSFLYPTLFPNYGVILLNIFQRFTFIYEKYRASFNSHPVICNSMDRYHQVWENSVEPIFDTTQG